MHVERIALLKTTLDRLVMLPLLPDGDGFNMGVWERKVSCGTNRCILGWHIHWNPDCGLALVPDPGTCSLFMWPTLTGNQPPATGTILPMLAEFFDLPEWLVDLIFLEGSETESRQRKASRALVQLAAYEANPTDEDPEDDVYE